MGTVNQLIKGYAWTIGFLVALVVLLQAIAALSGGLPWLVVLVVLVIVGRVVWTRTRW